MAKRWGRLLLGAGFFYFSFASAQVAIRVERPAKLFAQPSERSMILTEIGGRSSFRALEQSADKKWVFISDGLRYGWIRKVFVKAVDEASAVMSEMSSGLESRESAIADSLPPDADLPVDEDLDDAPAAVGQEDAEGDDFDSTSTSYVVKQPTPFYDQPKRNAQKFGKLLPNDEVQLLSSSQDSLWARIRLVETGEEGWIPQSRMGRKMLRSELRQLEAPSGKLTHLGLSGVLAPDPWNYGFLAFIRRGFPSLSIGTTPVEIAFGGGINVGKEEEQLNNSVKVSYIDLRLYAHWEPLLSPRWGLPVEMGMLYKYGSIVTELSPEQFDSINTRILESEFGGFIGVGVTYFVLDSLRLEFIPQVQLTSSVDLVLNAGAVFSF
ncbi:MAG: hypothetical protein R3A80_10710 [Bdellovibrionota bacterium]